jgi:hypothetical protein
MTMRFKAPSPAGFAVDLSPQGEVSLRDFVPLHLSLWGRGRRIAPGEGAFLKGTQAC